MPPSPDPIKMLEVARHLVAGATPEALRRAISTVYYALFHRLAAHTADRFVGSGDTSPTYAIIYRSLDHTRVRSVLVELGKSNIKASFRKALGRTTSSAALRKFADEFVAFQDLRHLADYDPFMPAPSCREVEQLIDEAARTLESFSAIDPLERAEVLALMIAGARA